MQKAGVCTRCSLRDRPYVQPLGVIASADVVIVCGFPMPGESERGAFTTQNGDILRKMVEARRKCYNNDIRPSVAYTHAVRCEPRYDSEAKKFAYNTENVQQCSVNLLRDLDAYKPKAIVAMGTDAVKALGFKQNASAMRGGIYDIKLNDGTRVPMVATFHIVEATRSPGLFPTLEKDIDKALRIASGYDFGGTLNAVVLRKADEIVAKLNEISCAADAKFAASSRNLMLAVDTETTSLTPSNPNDRVIAVSLAYRDGEGIAYPFEHMQNPFPPDEFAAVKDATERLLGNPHVTLVMCNGKFDMQWLRYRYAMNINPCGYDCQLAEHCLDEDKKGQYSLKDITRDRFPAMGKYEQELKEALAKKQTEFNEDWKNKNEAWKLRVQEARVQWWLDKDEAERRKLLASWFASMRVTAEEAKVLGNVKKRKVKGELVIPKKASAAMSRVLSAIDTSELDGLQLPEKDFPEQPKKTTFEDVDVGSLLWYAAIDAQATRMIAAQQIPEFYNDTHRVKRVEKEIVGKIMTKPLLTAFKEIDMPLSSVIADMEYNGVCIDRDLCAQYAETTRKKMDELRDSLYQHVGYKFKLSSSAPDLAKILFEDMKLPVLKRTESGAASTDADTLRQLCDEHDLPFLRDLLAYRVLEKHLSTYFEKWLKMSELDGKLHCSFNQIGTATFRLSSSNPNLQQVPAFLKEAGINVKSVFVPAAGYVICELDISNAEMRMLTAYSRDKNLIDAFNFGKDIHCLTGASISEYDYEDLKAHKEDKASDQYRKRQLAKKVNFGTIYGMSGKKFQEQIWNEMRIRESEEQCQAYLDGFFVAYPGVKDYMENTQRFVERFHFAYTYTGRRRRFPIAAYSRAAAARMGRQAVNARIQTTSSDAVLRNLIDIHNWLKSENIGRVLLTVHDSIVFEVREGTTGIMQQLKKLITQNTAERCPWLPVEWKFDAGCGPNYGDTHGEVL